MKKILINDTPWQTRVAIVENSTLQNIFFSGHAEEQLERAYIKGIVIKILPGIQTAFVDIGQPRAGFLHISEIDRELAVERLTKQSVIEDEEQQSIPPKRRQKLDISKILKEGEPVLVQVSKEPVYEKGAKLTTCFTLPGRFIVLLPNIPRIGISKKIESREERMRLRTFIKETLPEGMGAIIRTTSEGRDPAEITKDIDFLVTEWRSIQKKFDAAQPRERIHSDLPLSLQIVRDHMNEQIEAVITDNKKDQQNLYQFIAETSPENSHKVKLFTEPVNIFEFYHIEEQIDRALDTRVELKSGGSLIIETTEAMSVIDVNTGRFTGKADLEETILKANLEAAEETVRQLRLRNIGGIIVIDFIDMASESNRQRLFRYFEKELREKDRYQSVVLKISEFGLVQMTRKRTGKTLQQQLTQECSTCKGLGCIKSTSTQSYNVLRELKQKLSSRTIGPAVTIQLNPAVFEYITSTQYNAIFEFEKLYRCKITLVSASNLRIDEYRIERTL